MTEKRHAGRSEPASIWAQSGHYLGLGLTWALSVLLFFGIGWWIDARLGTVPLFAVLGALLGGAAGFYHLYRHAVLEPGRKDKEGDR